MDIQLKLGGTVLFFMCNPHETFINRQLLKLQINGRWLVGNLRGADESILNIRKGKVNMKFSQG